MSRFRAIRTSNRAVFVQQSRIPCTRPRRDDLYTVRRCGPGQCVAAWSSNYCPSIRLDEIKNFHIDRRAGPSGPNSPNLNPSLLGKVGLGWREKLLLSWHRSSRHVRDGLSDSLSLPGQGEPGLRTGDDIGRGLDDLFDPILDGPTSC